MSAANAPPALAMPRHRRGQKLAFHFDEDEVTLAWDAVRKASMPPGSRLAAQGVALPPWWWAGLGLVAADDAPIVLQPVATTFGPSVALVPREAAFDAQAEASRLHAAAPALPEATWQKVRLARDGPDTEADFPLGAFVPQGRHDEVTATRMRLPPGRVVSWTTVGPGAAPTEFLRLQDAVGAYHVAMVETSGAGRTVGLWAGPEAPRVGDKAWPVLRRLFRTQGSWRHGVKFASTP